MALVDSRYPLLGLDNSGMKGGLMPFTICLDLLSLALIAVFLLEVGCLTGLLLRR